MSLQDTVGSVLSGGVIGMIGSLGGAALKYVDDRAAHKERLEEKKVDNSHELEVLNLNQVAAIEASKAEQALTELKGSFDGLQKSIEDQTASASNAGPVVAGILALFRPSLTLVLMIVAIIFVGMHQVPLANKTIELVAMAVAWWFGDRQRKSMADSK